MPKPVLIAN